MLLLRIHRLKKRTNPRPAAKPIKTQAIIAMAKLRPEQLSAALNKGLAPIYIATGEEPLLIQETCDAIRAAARKAGFIERDLYHCDNHFDWSQVLASANSMSLFADKKIIELRIPSGKPGDKGGK